MFCITDNQWSFCKSLKKNVHHSTKLIKFRPKKKKKKKKKDHGTMIEFLKAMHLQEKDGDNENWKELHGDKEE